MTKKILPLLVLIAIILVGCATQPEDHPDTAANAGTTQGYALGQRGQVKQAAAAETTGLNQTVFYFGFDSTTLNAADLASIKAHARYLIQHPNAQIRLEGHTDERGSAEYNIGLGERRDQTIFRLLKVAGVKSDQIRLISYGKEKPAVLGHSEMAYGKNRRVEVRYARA